MNSNNSMCNVEPAQYREQGMQKYFRLFAWALVLDVVLTPLGATLGHMHVGVIFFSAFKIPFILTFLIAITFALKFGLKLNGISLMFLFMFPFFLIVGVSDNGVSGVSLSHLYGFIMPVVAASFGQYYAQYSSFNSRYYLYILMKRSFFILFGIIVLYFVLYKLGIVKYFGMSTLTAYFVAFFLSVNKVVAAISAVVATLFTGKRTVLLGCLIILLVYLMFSKKVGRGGGSTIVKVMLLLLMLIVGYIAMKYELLNRFKHVFELDINDARSLFLATGGRSLEIIALVEHVAKNSLWFSGGGIGETYLVPRNLSDSGEFMRMHYSHMSPLYLVLVYGLPFAIALYSYLFYLLVKGGRRLCRNFFFLVFVMLFATSFAGSVLFVDVKFWIFTGAIIGMLRYRKDLNFF